jgi:hypothetical protein
MAVLRPLLAACLLLATIPAFAQKLDPEGLSPADSAKRNSLLQPGLDMLKQKDFDAAYKILWPARKAFPADLLVLRTSAEAAFYSNHNPEALDLFNRALAEHPAEPWPLRLARLQVLARMGKWDDFDHDLAALRATKKSGDDHQLDSSSGFLIDGFAAGPAGSQVNVQTIVFPLQSDKYHTLYRFLLPRNSPAKTAIQARVNAAPADSDTHCSNPEFRPYLDLESDDTDQPPNAEPGKRVYSLDTYPTPCSQGLIKFYKDGEPLYQDVRNDVIKALGATPQTTP